MAYKDPEKQKKYHKQYREANKDRIKLYNKQHYESNKDYYKQYDKKYYEINREKKKEHQKQYYETNKNKHKESMRRWREINKDYDKQYYESTKDHHKEQRKQYYQINKDQIREKWNCRYRTDPAFRLKCNLRNRIRNVLKFQSTQKLHRFNKLLGCTPAQARAHLEAQFKPGMSWGNYCHDVWQIDHIRPIASFDLTDPQQQLEAFNYKNLQPLWAAENMSKGDKWEPTQQEHELL